MISKVSSILPKINRVATSENLAVLFCLSPNGKIFGVTIDRADLERVLAAGYWRVCNFRSGRGFSLYCYRNKKHGGVELLHRFLLGVDKQTLIDHAHHRTLDNRRSELRQATRSQNAINSHIRKDSTTGKRGVTPNPVTGSFRARIWANGKRLHLGQFPTAEQAAQAYDEAARTYHGEFAFTNAAAGANQ